MFYQYLDCKIYKYKRVLFCLMYSQYLLKGFYNLWIFSKYLLIMMIFGLGDKFIFVIFLYD